MYKTAWDSMQMIPALLLEMPNAFTISLTMLAVFEVSRAEYKLVKLELLWFTAAESGH